MFGFFVQVYMLVFLGVVFTRVFSLFVFLVPWAVSIVGAMPWLPCGARHSMCHTHCRFLRMDVSLPCGWVLLFAFGGGASTVIGRKCLPCCWVLVTLAALALVMSRSCVGSCTKKYI